MPLLRADARLHGLRREELGSALQATPPKPAFFEALREELSASSGESAATVTDDPRFDEACQRAQVTGLGPLPCLLQQDMRRSIELRIMLAATSWASLKLTKILLGKSL